MDRELRPADEDSRSDVPLHPPLSRLSAGVDIIDAVIAIRSLLYTFFWSLCAHAYVCLEKSDYGNRRAST